MQLKIDQSSDGYRYSIDSFLLADFSLLRPGQKIMDLGSGCGIVSLLLASVLPDAKLYGIEIQERLIELSRKNLYLNRDLQNISFVHGDIRNILDYFDMGEFDAVVTNPPYYKIGAGRLNPEKGKACARHEIVGELKDFIRAASLVLRPMGSIYIIYTTNRITELFVLLKAFKFEPKLLRLVYPGILKEANNGLIKAVKGGKPGMRVLPPLFLYEKKGQYTEEANAIFKRFFLTDH